MARKRMIDPDIWIDGKFNRFDYAGRLLWIGLISMANDYGKLVGDPDIITSQIFPKDKISIITYLERYNDAGMIVRYENNGEQYIKIKNWDKYQTLMHPAKDKIPEPSRNNLDGVKKTSTQFSLVKYSLRKGKHTFNEFVKLTKNEHTKLIEKFGERGTNEWIERLDNYIGAKGKKYKSHYRTILMWAQKDQPKNKESWRK